MAGDTHAPDTEPRKEEKEEWLITGLSDPKLTKQDRNTYNMCKTVSSRKANMPLALPKILVLLNKSFND